MSEGNSNQNSDPGRTSNEDDIVEKTPQFIVDSHIHLWPESMSNEEGHSWMTPGMPLARQHILSDYYSAAQQDGTSSSDVVEAVVYVETDVRYSKPEGELKDWAKGPLLEIQFLRNIVEGAYGSRDQQILQGIVAWAPMDQPTSVLEEWLYLVEQTAGPSTWKRIKGFRFLLQSILDQKVFETLVFSPDFIANLKLLGKRNFSFDIGVDQRSGGPWQLDLIAKAMTIAHSSIPETEKVTFIINHLCKPDFQHDGPYHVRWRRGVEAMSRHSKTYMKLSGAFSELPGALGSLKGIAGHMRAWVIHVLDCYGAERVMFGSDWPVCNVKRRDEGSWVTWKDLVGVLLEIPELKLSGEDRERIWRGTAREAYRLG